MRPAPGLGMEIEEPVVDSQDVRNDIPELRQQKRARVHYGVLEH